MLGQSSEVQTAHLESWCQGPKTTSHLLCLVKEARVRASLQTHVYMSKMMIPRLGQAESPPATDGFSAMTWILHTKHIPRRFGCPLFRAAPADLGAAWNNTPDGALGCARLFGVWACTLPATGTLPDQGAPGKAPGARKRAPVSCRHRSEAGRASGSLGVTPGALEVHLQVEEQLPSSMSRLACVILSQVMLVAEIGDGPEGISPGVFSAWVRTHLKHSAPHPRPPGKCPAAGAAAGAQRWTALQAPASGTQRGTSRPRRPPSPARMNNHTCV